MTTVSENDAEKPRTGAGRGDHGAVVRLSVPGRIARPERLALPALSIDGPRSFFFAVSGGIGDVCVALQVALAFLAKVGAKEGGREPFAHEWALGIVPMWAAPMDRLVRGLGVFDHVTSLAHATTVKKQLRHEPVLLPALLAENDDDACLSLGSTADYLWARWGMRGRFTPSSDGSPVRALRQSLLVPRYEELRATLGFPARGGFVLLTPESNYLGALKTWPVAHWRALVRDVQAEGREVVVCARPAVFAELTLGAARPCIAFDHSAPAFSADLVSFASVVDAAAVTVSLDSGPAHLASLLSAPCISLWGPTSPALYASPNTVALRVSLCPPCSTDGRAGQCTDNVCMKGIEPAYVNDLVRRLT
jgi:hypothetical protein